MKELVPCWNYYRSLLCWLVDWGQAGWSDSLRSPSWRSGASRPALFLDAFFAARTVRQSL